MGLFSQDQMDQINAVAAKSKEVLKPVQVSKSVTSSQHEIEESTKAVLEYFGDSPAILIGSVQELHDYITKAIESGYCSIDTETTGLDRIHDTIVGCSLYYPGGVECYIPNKHLVPIFETPYKNQLTYEEVGRELHRLVITDTKTIWFNADFDLAMIYKDYKVDLIPTFYYDSMVAWRCLKENETAHGLKALYAKYVQGGKGDPKKFSDFFSPKLFPYSKPDVAKLYAANDAKITYELFLWQLPYVTKSHQKCQKNHLERIADLVWNIEFPMVRVCALMHRIGIYFDNNTSDVLKPRYHAKYDKEFKILADMVDEIMLSGDAITIQKSPFKSGKDFNPSGSSPHIKYLLNRFMDIDVKTTDKAELAKLNLPVTNQILKVRSFGVLINSFVDKLPEVVGTDGRVHSTFNSIGASCITGDSLLLTNYGYIPIANLFDGTESDDVFVDDNTIIVNKNLQYEGVSHRVAYYNVPTIKVYLKGGFIVEGTSNHPIICSDISSKDVKRNPNLRKFFGVNLQFRELQDLSLGDSVCIPVGYNMFPTEYIPTGFTVKPKYKSDQADCKVPEYFTEDFAELMGMYFADGSMHDGCGHFSIRINNKDEDVIQRTIDLVNKVFALPAKKTWGHTTWSTEFGNKRIECIRDVFGRGAANKYIHSAIMQSPKSVVCAFIRGTTLDSSYDPTRQRLAISYYRKDSADFVHQALANMGIISSLTIQNHPNDVRYRVSVSGEHYKQFLDIVGVVQSSKRDIRDTYAHSKLVVRDNNFYSYVERIEYSNNTVYDLTVSGTHSFIANGMINHNTGRFSSKDPNVQNIPSHALDIRHQFRATPAMEKIDECELVDGQMQITLGSYDSVTINGGYQKDVIDLCIGDEIISITGVLKIRDITHNLPHTTIIFDSSVIVSIKHITPAYVMMSSDYSQQEPKLTAFISADKNMIDAFMHNKDIYATIAALSFNKPYEECMEFNPITGANQPEGKERRSQAKSIVLGICYGRTTKTIGEQLFGKNKEMTEEDRTKEAQKVYDAVLNAFPNLRAAMEKAQADARRQGFVETILGRRRHIPDMQLKPYEFKAGKGYVNPDVDPLDPKTLTIKSEIPARIVKALEKEFSKYKYKGQIYKRIKELEELDHILVINNTRKIGDATRQCLNSEIQGSAAELTKIAMLKVFNDSEWNAIGGRVIIQVHDELIAEVPIRNADKGAEILSRLMSEAGSFLPFTISCDVTTTLRWYGLSYPCEYSKPESFDTPDTLSESEIAWIQYQLFEMEYPLPIHKKEGVKLEGDKALGVDGEWSEDMNRFIADYMNRNHISRDEFLNHIENNVIYDLQKLN